MVTTTPLKPTSNEAPIIETHNLIQLFKKTRAVDGISLSIAHGELFGLIGPDGAGKTTTLRLLAGLLDISGGTATILGNDLQNHCESIKPYIGYMAQQFSLYAELSVIENLRFFAALFDVNKKDLTARTEWLLTFSGLSQFRNRRAADLSGGMQKKLALACTLIHRPEILLLDEPTTGVDPISRREFWNILTQLHIEGTTILISTPYMDEADRCSQVALMFAGKIIICDSPQNIRKKILGEFIEIQPENRELVLQTIIGMEGVREIQTYGDSLRLLVDSGIDRLPEIENSLKLRRIKYHSIRIAPARMEEAFISLIGKMESQ